MAPKIHENVNFVIGSRALGIREYRALTVPQVIGKWLFSRLM